MELTESRKRIIINLISEFKKSDTYTLYKKDFDKIVNDKSESKTIAETLIYKLKLVKNATKETYRLTENGIVFSSFEELEPEKAKIIMNSFNNSTIGQFNQSDALSVLKTEIKQIIHPKEKEKQQNAIISFISKFWWQILIPASIVLFGILVERNIIDIGI
jgi:hypothetical protein